MPLATSQLSEPAEKPEPFHQRPVATRRIDTSTRSSAPPPVSDAVPAMSAQPAKLYVPPESGNETTVAGVVRSIVQPKVAGEASVFPAVSVARTWNVCAPCARPV